MKLPAVSLRTLALAGVVVPTLAASSSAQTLPPGFNPPPELPGNFVATPPPPAGNLFFDYFFADNAGQPAENFGSDPVVVPGVNGFFLWTVSDGTVDLLGGNTPLVDDLPDGGRYVDLDGSTDNAGLFETRQTFPFAPGFTFELFFEYGSTDGQLNTADVSVAGRTFTVSTDSPVLARRGGRADVPRDVHGRRAHADDHRLPGPGATTATASPSTRCC